MPLIRELHEVQSAKLSKHVLWFCLNHGGSSLTPSWFLGKERCHKEHHLVSMEHVEWQSLCL